MAPYQHRCRAFLGTCIDRNVPQAPRRSSLPRLPPPRCTVWPSPLNTLPDFVIDEEGEVPTWRWPGEDDFTALNDRQDSPPLPLPRLQGQRRRIIMVRHGQSTWNARQRIQGSSDFSVLTEKGVSQAEATHQALANVRFDALFASPLRRAVQTAQVVWGARQGPAVTLPALREIDLYGFQGLDKILGRSQRPDEYERWQRRPHEFEIDGHWPVRELWYRASLAWRSVLTSEHLKDGATGLLVAHNAVNQALVCTALGLPPSYFRRLTQTNAAQTVVDFAWDDEGECQASIERFNCIATAVGPLQGEKLGRSTVNRLILIAGKGETDETSRALRTLSCEAPPLIAVGDPEAQAADVATATEAALSGGAQGSKGRMIVAIVAPETVQLLIDGCLGTSEESVGQRFCVDAGSMTVMNYHQGVQQFDQGGLLCVNHHVSG